MKKGAIIGIGIAIVIAAIIGTYAVSSQGIDENKEAGIGIGEDMEATIGQPEKEPTLAIKETVKQDIGVESESKP